MAQPTREALKLPDQLLVRYFRQGEIGNIQSVGVQGEHVRVQLAFADGLRNDHWRDLGGGLGYVPDRQEIDATEAPAPKGRRERSKRQGSR